MVYEYLSGKQLLNYYQLRETEGKLAEPVVLDKNNFAYLDSAEFMQSFCRSNHQGQQYLEFYLEGIHCLACLWLIEKIPTFTEGIEKVQLDMSKSLAKVFLKEKGSYAHAARTLSSIGHKPHPILADQDRERLRTKEERQDLMKIGIAGAFFGNIMLLSVSIYAGVEGYWLNNFRWMTFILALPVLLYSAYPFYKNAFTSLKRKVISIDLPIVLALFIGTATGLAHLIDETGDLYFDSLTALIFLLLSARYLLKKAQQAGLSPDSLSAFYQNKSVYKQIKNTQQFTAIHSKFIKINDVIKVPSGAYFPADGKLISPSTYSDHALLTGESHPITLLKDQAVYQGTKNLGAEVLFLVNRIGMETKLGKIIQDVKKGWQQKPQIIQKTDRLAKYFVLTVTALSIGLFITFLIQDKAAIGMQRALALIIVTCPCALGLAAPLALLNTLRKASMKGIFIKNENVLEKLTQITRLFLDKTGTLTYGNFAVSQWVNLKKSKQPLTDVIYSLEQFSNHPIAYALINYLAQHSTHLNKIPMINFTEKLGTGVAAEINGDHYSIRRLDQKVADLNENSSTIGVYENRQLISYIELQDSLRHDILNSMQKIKKLIPDISILSGDQQKVVDQMAKKIATDPAQAYGELTPNQKKEIMKKADYALMVGDGANDAPALSYAHVGVAVKGSVDISLRAADVYLTKPGLESIYELIVLAHETMKVMHRNFAFSLCYNIIGGGLAIAGLITPLAAAILMPLSSFTVLISSYTGTKTMQRIL